MYGHSDRAVSRASRATETDIEGDRGGAGDVSGAILPVRVRHMWCDSARPDSESCSLLCSRRDGQTTL